MYFKVYLPYKDDFYGSTDNIYVKWDARHNLLIEFLSQINTQKVSFMETKNRD